MLLFFIFFVILQKTLDSAAAATCEIRLNSNLTPSSSWFSPSGRFAFGFYPEGNGGFRVGIRYIESPSKTTVIWTSNRDSTPVSRNASLKFGNEGLKLLRATLQGEDQNISELGQSSSAYCAAMQDSGNFVIYDSDLTVVWQTFDNPTDTLMAGQVLFSDTELISSVSEMNHSSGKFRLQMQSDRNLVMYPVETDNTPDNAYWSSDTFLGPYSKLNLSEDGVLFLTNNNQSLRQNLTKGDQRYNPNTIHLARVEPNGMLHVYAYDLLTNSSAVLLDTKPDNQCQVKGICGLNSYCTFSGEKQICLCLPHFEYINAEDTQAGCQRNFISSTCLGVGANDTYYNTMDDLENVRWLRELLSPTEKLTSKDDCRDSCLHDCTCDVAIYKEDDGSCSKQSLPLKYGSKDMSTRNPTLTFVKRTDHRNITAAGGIGNASITTVKKELSGVPQIVFVAVVAGLIIFILVFVFILLKCHVQVGRYRMICRSNEIALTDGIAPRSFSYYELYEATGGYKDEVGKGAFGTVFRGTLQNTGKLVAVKRLEKVMEEGEREFQTEMKAIGRTHHRNLVRLLGFCNEGSNRLLVYEFMINGSLADLIFKPDDQNRPHWKERLRIALDVARGIHYLHEDCETHIIHCDIKPQNILMDENWTAKISDFGLAKLLMPTQTRTFTGIRGTRGYLAPEWHKNTPITVKADVYSFGIVLLEIMCCRKNMELEAQVDQIILSEWVYNCYHAGELEKLVLDEEVDMLEFGRLVTVGLWCIQTDPTQRPSMKNVILMLEGCAEISSPPPP